MLNLVRRAPMEPWAEGEKIPWQDPEFSRRMLAEHLSQEHDRASRRFEIVDSQVDWIHHHVLHQRPARILDLGCGPGFYTGRLARLGHTCTGIDFSPAAIEYARQEAVREGLECSHVLEDLRDASFRKQDLILMIHGEFNEFRRSDAESVARKAFQSLSSGGALLLEPHAFEHVRSVGLRPPRWHTAARGLFSDQPHIVLQEHAWHETETVATVRYHVIDAETAAVRTYAASTRAYSENDYRALLSGAGFDNCEFLPSLSGTSESQTGLFVITAHKR